MTERISVPERRLRISRRKLLEVSGLAPLALLAARGASAAEQAELAQALAKIPDPTMKALVGRATKNPDVDVDKFKLVASVLWRYFEAGAGTVKVPDRHAVLLAAYDKKPKGGGRPSGDLIVERLGKWDMAGHNPATNSCAYRAGWHAARLAVAEDRPENSHHIDTVIFSQAWDITEAEQHAMLARLRALQQMQGKDVAQAFFGDGC